ncbi:ABC transporter substrate-binding protein [Desulfovibrio gilichinskyi]|uniref:Amino acid/amide ABC transporter substrate-binding protein, HAAT family n=1 Tax=Desulfovibrio gilichinskyi TaxID=1519643 RepID=A0A1X7CU62_9BACT|nr:ABC transporter substrate-binding protein [Desulfovibrio gilichinskyi]SMF03167.1 amino acid/amide ABC transporter substrate-binding protein, HAAT family [Desulfovibrio gilichinskyi]
MDSFSNMKLPRVLFILIFLCLFLCSCSEDPIRIGFSGSLKGKYSDLGVQGRNGVTLAVEDINRNGGINGRKLELLIRDDENTSEGAVKADRELIKAGVSVIFGHMTSSQSLAAIKEIKENEVIFISPTTSTNLIQGINDNFFRVIPTLTNLSQSLAEYAVKTLGKKRVAVLWDRSNKPFAEPYKDTFVEFFTKNGGKIVGEVDFSSYSGPVDWKTIMDKLKKLNPDSIIAVTAARDLAVFAQHSKLDKTGWTILSSMWGYTKELIQTGGKSVEGVIFSVHFAEDISNHDYENFKQSFIARFGWPPNFAAAFGYESVMVFAEAVKRNDGSTKGLAKVLPSITFKKSIVGPFRIDEFGDVEGTKHIVEVRNGTFVSVSRGKK